MAYFVLGRTATVEVYERESLMYAWKKWGGPLTLVGRFILHGKLTASQRRRLPKSLLEILEVAS